MFGMFNLFGRSREIQRLDQALRGSGIHPQLVPDAVKIAGLKLLKEAGGDSASAYDSAMLAEMLAYCMLGPLQFTEMNDLGRTEAVEARVEDAVKSGDSLDARLVLLALHAGITQPSVIERHGLEID